MKKFLALALAVVMLAVMVIPAFAYETPAEHAAAKPALAAYLSLFGENELTNAFDGDYWDWTEGDKHVSGILNLEIAPYLPGTRIQVINVNEGATGLISVNWRFNLNTHGYFACVNYDVANGTIEPTADAENWWTVTVDEALPAAERIGRIQFITTDEYTPAVEADPDNGIEAADAKLVQRTYANGKLLYEQVATDPGALMATNIKFGIQGANGEVWSATAQCVMDGYVQNLSALSWSMDKDGDDYVAYDYNKIAVAYAAFAENENPTDLTAKDYTLAEQYELIMGEMDDGHALFGADEIWEWSELPKLEGKDGLHGVNWLNVEGKGAGLPNVRMNTYYIATGATGSISVNWQLVKSNNNQAGCINYNVVTGVLSQTTDAADFFEEVYSVAVPEAERTGHIQFITTDEFDTENKIVTQKTYANGKLVLVQTSLSEGAYDALTTVTFRLRYTNGNTTELVGRNASEVDGLIWTESLLGWKNGATDAATVAKLYAAFANYWDIDDDYTMIARYENIMGTDDGHALFGAGEIWEWSELPKLEGKDGLHGVNWLNVEGKGAGLPNVRLNTYYIATGATGSISVNWQLVKTNNNQAGCINYNIETGVVSQTADAADFFEETFSEAIPAANRTGHIQFITTDEFDTENKVVTQKTYANGKLVLVQTSLSEGAYDALTTVTFRLRYTNGNTTEITGRNTSEVDGLIWTESLLGWKDGATDEYSVQEMYRTFAEYWAEEDDSMYSKISGLMGADVQKGVFGETWEWTNTDDTFKFCGGNCAWEGYNGIYGALGIDYEAGDALPAVRLQTLKFNAASTGKIGINTLTCYKPIKGQIPLGLLLDLETGEMSQTADANNYFTVIYKAPVETTGLVQFITTDEVIDGAVYQRTYANGKLVFTQVAVGAAAATLATTRVYLNPVNDGDALNSSAAYVDGDVKLMNKLVWMDESALFRAEALYDLYADYYAVYDPWDAYRVYVGGVAVTGWYNNNYYLKTSFIDPDTGDVVAPGVQVRADKVIGGIQYFWNGTNLEKRSGWVEGSYYYKDTGFKCEEAVAKIGGLYYSFDTGVGELLNDLFEDTDAGVFYYIVDGAKAYGWVDGDAENGGVYARSSDGALILEDAVIGGKYYKYNEDDGILELGDGAFDGKYYVAGEKTYGWQNVVDTIEYTTKAGTSSIVKSGEYYLYSTYEKCTEDKVIGGFYYYYNESTGNMEFRQGWVDGQYYLKASGQKVTADKTIGGVHYTWDGSKLVAD